jgi:hypothetical protein
MTSIVFQTNVWPYFVFLGIRHTMCIVWSLKHLFKYFVNMIFNMLHSVFATL